MTKNKIYALVSTSLWVIFLTILPCAVKAQDPGPCPDCPMDQGVILLLMAGAAYGVKKYKDKNRETELLKR